MKSNIVLVLILVSLFSCRTEVRNSVESGPDYSHKSSWVRFNDVPVKDVDVFFVYPTIFNGDEMMNMNIHDSVLRNKAEVALKKQVGVFTEKCDVFAPYYRQMSMSVLTMPNDSMDKYFTIGYGDVKNAFLYYLENHNNNRPFILAGHSQGSQVLLNLMMELFSDSLLSDKLVAAYTIGYSVTDENIKASPWLKIAQKYDDTGVIITYNTQSPNATGSPVLLPGANCVNPLSWSTDTINVSRMNNFGAVFFDDNGAYEKTIVNFTNARISEDGALIADDANIGKYSTDGFPEGVYHVNDYSFYYLNLKENVGKRVDSYLAGKR